MIANAGKRFLALMLALVMVFSLLPMQASAAEVETQVLDGMITVKATPENAKDTMTPAEDGSLTATATATSSTSCGNTTYTQKKTTITITNTSGSSAIVGFHYEVTGAKSFDVCGISGAASGDYSETLENGASFTITISSDDASTTAAKITLSKFSLTVDSARSVSFTKPVNGTATAGGTELSTLADGAVHTVSATFAEGVAVTATPASGYSFLAWLDSNNNILSTTANTILKPNDDMTVTPVFVADTSAEAWWQTGGKAYTDLNTAASDAASGDKTVVLMRNATLPAGDYTIPAGVTLLIPFDTNNTLYTTDPVYTTGSGAFVTPSPFRTLTMASGANLIIQGALSVSAKHATIRGGKADGSAPTGKYGHIKMDSGSTINVSGALYAWGYISGDGIITAENGAVVYENMQFTDFRGGTKTAGMIGNAFFPMSQYYVQNIETKLILKPGSAEYALLSLEANETVTSTAIKFIAPSGGMFATSDSTTVTKDYHPETDSLEITVDGNFSINSLQLSLSGVPILGSITINSANYILPINSNIDIVLLNGTTTVNQNLALLPGASVTVGENATLNISSKMKVFLYDRDDYVGKGFVNNNGAAADLACAPYSPDTRRVLRTSADLLDALIDVNGTINLSGSLYTTSGGAEIISSDGTGKIVFAANAGTEKTTQQNDINGDKVTINITSAKLLNGDGVTYVPTANTAAGGGFVYVAELDQWMAAKDIVVTYDPNGIPGETVTDTVVTKDDFLARNTTFTIAENTVVYDGVEFECWNTAADGSGTSYAPGDELTVWEDLTLYVQWKSDNYYITYYANGAEGTMETQVVPNTVSSITLNTLSLTRDGYRFAGWATTADGEPVYADGEIITTPRHMVLYAVWVQVADITFHDGDASDPYTQTVDANVKTALKPNEFKAIEGMHFAGWATEQDGEVVYTDGAEITVPGATDLYAVWEPNEYTLTWVIDGEPTNETVAFGSKISAPENPTKEGHTFIGWDAEIPETMPAGNVTITALWEINQYTVTFVTDDDTVISSVTQNYDTAVTAPADPEKEGYTFAGWDADGDGVADTVVTTVPAADMKYTALWTINSYTITFDTNGGNAIDPITQDYDTAVEAPADPTREGYTFAGWDVAIPGTMPAEDMTITASWTINQYTITIDTDGGTAIDPITLNYGEPIPEIEVPEKEGHRFAGWDADIPGLMPAENLTIKALWDINQYTITFNTDGGTAIDPITLNYGDAIPEVADPTKEGHDFAGWDVTIPETMPAEDMTITASWTINQYTITFDTDGGTPIDPITQDYGTVITVPDAPEKEGHRFAGWDAEIPGTMPAEDMTIKALWDINQYTIIFDTDGGTAIDPITLNYGETIPEVADPEKEGHDFAGWDVTIPETMPAEDMTITASWTINQYTITFDTDGGTPIDPITQDYGTVITVPDAPEKEGHDFAGWDKEIPGTMPAEDITITAQWTVNEYLISFMNGDQVLQASNVPYGTVPVYSGETPAKEADSQYTYTFAGWDVDGDGIADEICTVTGETTYYAVFTETLNTYTITWLDWDGTVLELDENVPYGEAPSYDGETPEREATAEYTYTFNGWTSDLVSVEGDATYTADYLQEANYYTVFFTIDGEEYDSEYLTYGSQITVPEAPTKEGYTFSGWSAPDIMPAQDLYVDATWIGNEYTIVFVTDDAENPYHVITAKTDDAITADMLPADPVKEHYTFAGWDPAVPATMPVYGATVTATWTPNQYLITFKNGDVTLQASNVTYDTVPVYAGDVPTKEADAQYTYTFAGWDADGDGAVDEIGKVTGVATYEAVFTETLRTYTITWKNWDGKILETDENVPYGTVPSYDGETPVKEATAEYSYTFNGWTPAVSAVAGDAAYTAEYLQKANVYTVTFTINGEVYETVSVAYGEAITAPKAPEQEGYTFNGWNVPATMPAEDITLDALLTVNRYTITFDTDGGTAIDPITQDYGTEVSAPADPTKEGYTFAGWDVAIPETMPAKDMTITALWTANDYTIVFITDDLENPYHVITAKTDDEITADMLPADPEKEHYTFTGWNPEVPAAMPVNGLTVFATWTVNKNTITFHANGAENEMEAQVVEATNSTAALNANTLTRAGYRFAGWAISADGEVIYADGATIEISGNVELYAVWVQLADIAFHDGENTYAQTVDANVETALKRNEFEAAKGMHFAGWATEQGGEAVYADGAKITVSAATNLYAVWAPNEYTLTWIIDGVTTSKTVAYGAAISAPATPSKIGHTFDGWTGDTIPETMPAGDLTIELTSNWKVNQYTITFDSVGGSAVDPITQEFNTAVNAPADPEKVGYTFAGWDVDGDGNADAVVATMPAEDMKYTALWSINSYVLTFLDGDNTIMTQEVTYGADLADLIPAAPEKVGYTFNGWSPAVPATMPAADVTVSAQWTAIQTTITFVTDGGTEIPAITQDYGTAVTAPADPEREGYTFAGWDKEIPATQPAEDMTITATWTVNEYTLTFKDKDEDEIILSVDVPYGDNLTEYLPDEPTKEGYVFGGWSGLPETMPAKDLEVTAIWNLDSFTLTFLSGDTIVSQETLEYQASITAPEDPEKEGYTFKGWDLDGDGEEDEILTEMPAENVTYTAIWSVNQYTLTLLDVDGSELDKQTLDYGAAIVVATPSKEGYTFTGWDKEIPATMPANDLVFTATWIGNEYTIVFVTDDAENPYHVITAKTDDAITADMLPADPVKEHYTFAGWDPAVPATMPVYGATVTATWTPNQYLITFKNGDVTLQASNVTYDTVPVYAGDVPTKEADAQYTYTFAGWDADGDGAVDEIGKVTGVATYEAVFTETLRTYAITWKNWDGKILETDENVPYGTVPSYDGETPVKEATAEYSYTFNGWTPAVSAVAGDAAYTAEYQQKANVYTVTFTINGEVYETVSVAYGEAITAPKAPEQEGYTFSGWNVPATMPAADITLDALLTVNRYTITWDLGEGAFTDAFGGELPTSADYNSDVTITGWMTREGYDFVKFVDQDGNEITNSRTGSDVEQYSFKMPAKDVTITAVWEMQTFTVIWKNWDGTVLETDAEVPYGSAPEYNGDEPTRAADNVNTYAFAGWTPGDVDAVKADVTFTATYDAAAIVYTVKFVDGEKELTGLEKSGGYETEITLPELDSTAEVVFLGWKAADGTVYEPGASFTITSNETLTAVWEAQKYTLIIDYLSGTDETGAPVFDQIEHEVPVGASLADYLPDTASVKADGSSYKGVHTIVGWENADTGDQVDPTGTMPAEDMNLCSVWVTTGWVSTEDGTGYLVENVYQTGLICVNDSYELVTDGSGDWYYADEETNYIVTGWQEIDGAYYCFDGENGAALVGEQTVDVNGTEVTYVFAEDGKLTGGVWVTDSEGSKYYYGPDCVQDGWQEIDGETYFFEDGYCYTGYHFVRDENGVAQWYDFGEDGALVGKLTYTGLLWVRGELYYLIDGVSQCGLQKLNGYFYYFRTSTCAAVRDDEYYLTNLNGYNYTNDNIQIGTYAFDAEGRMIDHFDAEFIGASLSLKGDIGLNFYVKLSYAIRTDPTAYIQFNVGDSVLKLPLSDGVLDPSDGSYRFSVALNAKNMGDTVTAQVYNENGTICGSESLSIKDYADYVIANSANEKLVDLMKAMLNYGAAAQVEFGYDTEHLVNADLAEEDKVLPQNVDVSGFAYKITGERQLVQVTSASLLLKSETKIRIYFQLASGVSIDDITITVDGETVTPVQAGDEYYIEKTNVAAKDLDTMYTFQIGDVTLTYCGLSYVDQVQTYSSNDVDLMNLVSALYAYNQAANVYFGG